MRISDWSSDVCSSDLLERRGIVDPRAEHQQRALHVAIIEAVAGRVAIVEHQRGLDRNIGIRPRETAAQLGAERVAELVVDRPRKLIEFGHAFAMIALGDRKSVVEGQSVSGLVDIVGRRILKNNKTRATSSKCY